MNQTPFCRINILLVIGLVFAAFAFLTHSFLPLALENVILENIVLSPNSTSFEQWRKSSIEIHQRFYFFNITNIDRVFSENDKPRLEQLGPYTFSYSFEKSDITWNHEEGKVDYKQIKRWSFIPSLTNGSLDDEIYHLNVPLMSAFFQIQSAPKDDQYTAYESLNSIIESFNLTLHLRNRVKNLLFHGYEDNLLKMASQFYPTKVKQTRFGWFYGRNNTADGIFRIYTGTSDGMGKKLGLIDAWNNATYNSKWNSGSKCQSFNHTSAGELQPPFFLLNNNRLLRYFRTSEIDIHKRLVRLFNAEMCRTIELEYSRKIILKDIETYRYEAAGKMLNYSIEENKCYCQENSCPPNGLYHVGACSGNAPIYISYPHFLFADPQLLKQVDGLEPDVSKHKFYMDFDKQLGMPLNVRARLQINLFVKKYDEVEIMEDWPENLNEIYLPQFWSSVSTTIDDTTAAQLSFIFNYLPLVIFGLTVIFAGLFLSVVLYLLVYTYSNRMFFTVNTQIVKYESVCVLENENNGDTSNINMKDIVII